MISNSTFWVRGAYLGLISSLVVSVILGLGSLLAGLPFVPFNLFDWMARILPGPLITFGIDLIVAVINAFNLGPTASTAKLAEQLIAISQFIGFGVLSGVLLAWADRRKPDATLPLALILTGLLWIVSLFAQANLGFSSSELLISAVWIGTLFTAWFSGLTVLLRQPLVVEARAEPYSASRRKLFKLAGTSAGAFFLFTIGLRFLRDQPPLPISQTPPDVPLPENIPLPVTSGEAAAPSEQVLAARLPPAPGTRPELTPLNDFYRIDINLVSPKINGETWRLEMDGLVDQPLSLSLEEIYSRPSVSQYATLSCISNPVAGDLIGTTLWTGVRLRDILSEVGLHPEAKAFYLTAVDGFYETVTLEDAMDERTLLVYAMGGLPLTPEHGYPLRIYIPDRYGMKQPKWITRIEAVDTWKAGYWVDRGWSRDAFMRTTSVIDTIAISNPDPETKSLPIGGIAHGGARGISKVEIQVDDGDWQEAQLRQPPLSPLTWVQWRYDWPAVPGRHIIKVRAYDGTGLLQETEVNDVHPNGATGIHTLDIAV